MATEKKALFTEKDLENAKTQVKKISDYLTKQATIAKDKLGKTAAKTGSYLKEVGMLSAQIVKLKATIEKNYYKVGKLAVDKGIVNNAELKKLITSTTKAKTDLKKKQDELKKIKK